MKKTLRSTFARGTPTAGVHEQQDVTYHEYSVLPAKNLCELGLWCRMNTSCISDVTEEYVEEGLGTIGNRFIKLSEGRFEVNLLHFVSSTIKRRTLTDVQSDFILDEVGSPVMISRENKPLGARMLSYLMTCWRLSVQRAQLMGSRERKTLSWLLRTWIYWKEVMLNTRGIILPNPRIQLSLCLSIAHCKRENTIPTP